MKKSDLEKAVADAKAEYKSSLQTLWDAINKGQRKQLYKIQKIKALLDRYGVEVGD